MGAMGLKWKDGSQDGGGGGGWVGGWEEWRDGGMEGRRVGGGNSAERCVLSEATSLSDVGKGDRPGQPERQGERGGECEGRG